MKELTWMQFEEELLKKHDKIYKRCWSNYPNSIFYYDTPDIDGTTDNIGIYTSITCYSLDPA